MTRSDSNRQRLRKGRGALALLALLLSVTLAGVSWSGSVLAPNLSMPALILSGAVLASVLSLLLLRSGGPGAEGRSSHPEGLRPEEILRQAAEGVLTINQRGEVLSLNPAAERLFGYPAAEVLRQPITKLLAEPPPQERQQLRDTLPVGTILGLAAGAREMIGKRKNGDTFPIELTGTSMSSAEEFISVAFVRDVSKRKRAQRYLTAHYAATCILAEANSLEEALPRLLQAVCEALHWEVGAYWRLDADAGVAHCAQVHQAHFAALPRQVNAEPLICPRNQGLTGRVWSTGKPVWTEDVPDTTDLPCRGLAASFRLHGGFAFPVLLGQEVCGVMTFFSSRKQKQDQQLLDIMVEFGKQLGHFIARKRDEEALRETTQTLEALVQAAPVAIHITDLEGKVRLWNPAAERILGWTAAEVLNRPLPLLCEGGAQAEGNVAPGPPTRDCSGHPVRCRRKDGVVIDASLSTAPLHNATGTIFGVVGIRMDLTEQKQLENQLRQAQKMEAVGQLAGGVAHDFNNLLTIITGYSEILLGKLRAKDPGREFLEQILNAGERAAALTRQLLAFSRKSVLQPRVLDLNELVANLQKMLGRLIGEDIQLVTTLAPALGRVKADPGQLEQILVNLAVNARDAMPTGGRLIVETHPVELETGAETCPELRPGRYAILLVSDTGCGMNERTLARIFEPFFTTKEQGKGTGLGLATVYGIVKQSGGHVSTSSEPGKGTTFKVYLPIVEESTDTPRMLSPGLSVPGGKETVLLVEDERGVRTLARQLLQSNGYTVLEAANGEEALRVTEQKGTVDLLLTDVVMPQLGGRALAEAVTSRYPAVSVLYMSGYTDDAVIRNGVLQSGNDLLQKPFTREALLYKVRNVLDKNKVSPCEPR